MRYYPMMVRLHGKSCLVVGGGQVAERKIDYLLQAGATLTIIAPQATCTIMEWVKRGLVTYLGRPFEPRDVFDQDIIIAATNQSAVNLSVYESTGSSQWINIVDRPDLCSFMVPSVINRGDLQIAISTGGHNPGLSKKIRLLLEDVIGPEYENYIEFLGKYRSAIVKSSLVEDEKKRLLSCLLEDRFYQLTKEEKYLEREKEWLALMKE